MKWFHARRKSHGNEGLEDAVDVVDESVKEFSVETFMDNLKDAFAQHGIEGALSHLIGLVTPRLSIIHLNYKLARQKRNFESLQRQVSDHRALVNHLFKENANNAEWIRKVEEVLTATLDAVCDEPEAEKIQYFTNGTIRAIYDEEINILRHRYFLELLTQCSTFDISILSLAIKNTNAVVAPQYLASLGIDADMAALSVQKLHRLGVFDMNLESALEGVQQNILEIIRRQNDGHVYQSGLQGARSRSDIRNAARRSHRPTITRTGSSFYRYFQNLGSNHPSPQSDST